MKALVLILFPLFSFAQPKFQALIDVGLTHGMTVASRVGAQVSLDNFLVADASFRYTKGAYDAYFSEGLTGGVSLNFKQVRLIMTAGGYLHQFNINEKGNRVTEITPGGQLIVQRGIGIFGAEYNGHYGTLFVGIALFNPKEPCEVCVY